MLLWDCGCNKSSILNYLGGKVIVLYASTSMTLANARHLRLKDQFIVFIFFAEDKFTGDAKQSRYIRAGGAIEPCFRRGYKNLEQSPWQADLAVIASWNWYC